MAAAAVSPASPSSPSSRTGGAPDGGVLSRPCYRFEISADASRATECEVIVVVGHKADLASAFDKLSRLTDGTSALLTAMIADTPAPSAAPVVRETFMGSRVIVVMLPEACSHHNCPAHPHAISKALSGIAFSGPCMVVAAVHAPEYLPAYCVAVAKAFPMYSRKSGAGARASRRTAITLVPSGAGVTEEALDAVRSVCASARIAAALVDAPASELHTDAFVDIALKVAADSKATSTTVIRGVELRDRGFGGLWGVGKAATHLPALVVLEHRPAAAAADAPSICLVGKGIVYDTGGLSIKSKDGMPGMKRDMGGAAAVLGAFRTLSDDVSLTRPVYAILCLAENSVSDVAMRPDDILYMYSGKTVEVNNTDAEGRLVMADGAAYAAKHLNPGAIIDIATLTGAQGVATGRHFAALYTNNPTLESTVPAIGRATGELCHALPYCPEFFNAEFASAVADMKNSVADRANAQSSCAGQFVGAHIEPFVSTPGNSWLHVDMAYPSFVGARATGYGVALLAGVVRHLSAPAE
ncbi:hypothetical protein FNF28_05596 [Cafeteria roenbergensis]|uniref:Cytosol aminopeptidase domain-containing protein n=1 Tax=Cafeteria roenbergensis TaxID=33653 RepID=A0A5A8D3T2_CAFRO|nr:hypothetical protein FNF28_05596 [Cafeteria roenbergensis]